MDLQVIWKKDEGKTWRAGEQMVGMDEGFVIPYQTLGDYMAINRPAIAPTPNS